MIRFYLPHVFFQILTNEAPFASYIGARAHWKDWRMINLILDDKRPRRTPAISDNMWEIMGACWVARPEERLSADDIVRRLCIYSRWIAPNLFCLIVLLQYFSAFYVSLVMK